ncbi:MAG: TlpA family protein disulfide reductase [Halomonadaceae bacterium]|nr:MAG: TlpA family protein disulfide reductase [Halomonadaceae bacterium]
MNALNQSLALGPLAFSLGQLLLAFAMAMALLTGWLLGRRRSVVISDTLINTLLISMVGARLVFVLVYLDSYDSLLGMLDIRDGGFHLAGGLVAGLGYGAWALWHHSEKRHALGGAYTAGLLSWGLIAGGVLLIEQQARPLPSTPMVTLEGDYTNLQALAEENGKPMVVNVWATWCPPCRREMPVFQAAQQEHDEFTFVFVNQGEQASQIHRFMDDTDLTLDNILLDVPNALGPVIGVMGLPTTLYYDAQGQLVDSHMGEVSRATLQRSLNRLQ